ncbi:flagellar biosynthetic protein FliO [Evansella sp. AB-rgal1]|uniref:flagellar biosynthetic protein FliO n=1 Tax=Evansella sp. AB-rgal1 TaxID=3242696 RepID=UPI00359DE287
MKQLWFSLILLLFLFPIDASAEEFGEGNGTVENMFRTSDSNLEDTTDEEPSDEKGGSFGNSDDNTNIIGTQDQNLFLLSLQMFLALGVVIFLIYALLKFVNSRSRSFRTNTTIESIGGVPLGSNRSVQIVRVGNKLYVVGVGDSINLLKEIDDSKEVEKIIEEHRPQEVFDQPLTRVTEWLRGRILHKSSVTSDTSFQHLLQRELKGVKESQEKVHSALKEKD